MRKTKSSQYLDTYERIQTDISKDSPKKKLMKKGPGKKNGKGNHKVWNPCRVLLSHNNRNNSTKRRLFEAQMLSSTIISDYTFFSMPN